MVNRHAYRTRTPRTGYGIIVPLMLVLALLVSWLVAGAAADTVGSVNMRAWFGSTAPTVGQKAMASSIPVTLASDQSTLATAPGALTLTAAGQQAVSAVCTALPANASKQVRVKVLTGGTQTVFIGLTGCTTANSQELGNSGDSLVFAVANSNTLFVIAAGVGSTVGFDVLN